MKFNELNTLFNTLGNQFIFYIKLDNQPKFQPKTQVVGIENSISNNLIKIAQLRNLKKIC